MYISKFESDSFHLNFYRSDDSFFKENDLAAQKMILKNNDIDVVKFIIPSTRYDLSNQFNAFRNFTFLSTNIQYYKDTSVLEDYPLLDAYKFEKASINQKDILLKMIKNIFEEDTFKYYNIPFLKGVITKEQEIGALQNYLLDMLDKPNSGIHFFVDTQKNEIIGFSSYQINEQHEIYRAYAGILPNKRNSKYYEYFIYTVLQYNYRNHLTSISFGARDNNISLINKYNRLGFIIKSINYIYIALV